MADIDATKQKMDKLAAKHGEYRADFQGTISGWAKSLRTAIAVKQFGENDIIKKVRKGLAKEIQEMNQVLLYSEDLSQERRTRIFDKRGMYLQFLNLFRTADITIENIEQAVSFELGDNPQKGDDDADE